MEPNKKYLKTTEQLAELGGWCEGIHELGDPCCYVRDREGLEAFAKEMQWPTVADINRETGAEPEDMIGKIFTICNDRLYVWGDKDRMAVLGPNDTDPVDFWPDRT